MGYRSDVKYVMAFKKPEERAALIAAIHLEYGGNPDAEWVLPSFKQDSFKDVPPAHSRYPYRIQVHHEDIKWYESYPEVQMELAIMKKALDFNGGYAFMRIGEEDDDVESFSGSEGDDFNWYDFVQLVRHSEFV